MNQPHLDPAANGFLAHARNLIAHAELDQEQQVTLRRHSLKGSLRGSAAQAKNHREIAEAIRILRRDAYEVAWSKATGPTGVHYVTVTIPENRAPVSLLRLLAERGDEP